MGTAGKEIWLVSEPRTNDVDGSGTRPVFDRGDRPADQARRRVQELRKRGRGSRLLPAESSQVSTGSAARVGCSASYPCGSTIDRAHSGDRRRRCLGEQPTLRVMLTGVWQSEKRGQRGRALSRLGNPGGAPKGAPTNPRSEQTRPRRRRLRRAHRRCRGHQATSRAVGRRT